jgi:hypothetical protein
MKKTVVVAVLGGVLLFVLLLSFLTFRTGSIVTAFAYLNGSTFSVSPQEIDLGSHDPGTEHDVTFHLRNFSGENIGVVGEASGCSCAFAGELPIVVPPKEIIPIKVHIKLPKYRRFYDQEVTLMVETKGRTLLYPVRVTATVPNPLPPPAEDETSAETGHATESEPATEGEEETGAEEPAEAGDGREYTDSVSVPSEEIPPTP